MTEIETTSVAAEGLPRPTGDTEFEQMVEPHRASLHAHCYRMLGSIHDADDAFQDALVRAWRGLEGFAGQSAHRTWLHRIATNTCLDVIAQRRRRFLPADAGPAGTPEAERPLPRTRWIEPYPTLGLVAETHDTGPEARYDQLEAIELAFIAAIQYLPAKQRAALILRDVLGFSAAEVAETLDSTATAVHSALQRARATIDERLPDRASQPKPNSIGDQRVRDLVERFTQAFEVGDVAAILDLLAEDVRFSMPPYPEWCEGREAVGNSWLMPGGPAPRLRYLETSANGLPALGTYLINPDGSSYSAIALDILRPVDDRIAEVYAFRLPDLFPRFGLPEQLEAATNRRSAPGP